MGQVVSLRTPATVEYDGQALTVVAALSKIAVDLASISNEKLTGDAKNVIDNSVAILKKPLRL